MKNVITKVLKESIAEELEIQVGDILTTINGLPVKDVFDYRYMITDSYIELGIEKDGEQWIFEIDKDESEDIGIEFENGLMDNVTSCKNKCIFCFIDQLPKGMRKTLYFKDDDTRMSFLQGNYVTLTNISEEDFERILFYKLSPINVSVHTTNMELRHFMLKNPNSKNLMNYIKRIYENNVEMNFQVVLCKGINDGEHLEKTISDLLQYGKSLSVVPIGLSKYRDNLHKMEPFTKEDAITVIETVTKYQNQALKEKGTRFVYIADEFYLLAEKQLPDFNEYEDFPQIENGVGVMSYFKEEINQNFKKKTNKKAIIVTGTASYQYMKNICEKIGDNLEVVSVTNDFFGEKITVSGLLTGIDIYNTLKNKNIDCDIFIPDNCIKDNSELFLDDMTITDLSNKLNSNVVKIPVDGKIFLEKLNKEK